MLEQFRTQKLEWNRANNQIYDRVEANSGDSNGRALFVQILNGGMVEDLTGAVLSLAWHKGTAQGLEAFDEVDAKKGQFRLYYPTGMLVNHGVLQASLVLVDVTGRIESKPFDIIVHKGAVDDEAVESDNKFTALTTALVKVSQVQAEFDGLYADKSQMMDTLHDDKKADMEALEQDYANRANTLETTYAPRLTGVEGEIDEARGGAQTLGKRLDSDKAEVSAQLAQKVSKGNVNINDFDESTRQTFLEAQGIDVNYVLGDGNVQIDNLAFTRKSSNLFNKTDSKPNTFVDGYTGEEKENASFVSSGFTPVRAETTYTLRGVNGLVFYDKNKTHLSRDNETTFRSNYTFTTPSNCAYIRFYWVKSSSITIDVQQLNEGSAILPYEPYFYVIDKRYVEKHPINQTDLPPIPIAKLDFSVKRTNLFNKDTVTSDHYVSTTTGALMSSAGFVASDFIPIKPSHSYTIRTLRRYAFYDKDKLFISGKPDATPVSNLVVETPENAHFIRFSWYPASISVDAQQANEGAELLPYEEYGYYIPSEFIENETGSGQSGVSLKINLPPEIYAVTGKEVNIYFDNIANLPLSDYQVDVTCSLGKQMSDRWTATPANAGNHQIKIAVYKDFEMVAQVNGVVRVKDADAGSGVTRNALVIGDSTIAQDYLINHLEDTFTTDAMTVNFKGTRGTHGETHNEGYAGWTVSDLRTSKEYQGVVHPFYNPQKNDFDFGYYMNNQGYANLNYVVLYFGINDTFSYTSDEALLNNVPNALADFDYIVNDIKSYDSNIKIGICVTIPPNASQDAFGEAYSTGQTQWRYKRNNALWIEQLINAFKGKTPQNIYLIPDNSGIDATIGFRDGVHPNKEVGDKQRADTLYSWFKSFEV